MGLERNLRLNFNEILCTTYVNLNIIINYKTIAVSFSNFLFRVGLLIWLLRVHANSVTVNFDFFLGGDALVDEEFENVTSVVTLKLNDVTPLAVLCGVSIAAPRLLKVARQLSHV